MSALGLKNRTPIITHPTQQTIWGIKKNWEIMVLSIPLKSGRRAENRQSIRRRGCRPVAVVLSLCSVREEWDVLREYISVSYWRYWIVLITKRSVSGVLLFHTVWVILKYHYTILSLYNVILIQHYPYSTLSLLVIFFLHMYKCMTLGRGWTNWV